MWHSAATACYRDLVSLLSKLANSGTALCSSSIAKLRVRSSLSTRSRFALEAGSWSCESVMHTFNLLQRFARMPRSSPNNINFPMRHLDIEFARFVPQTAWYTLGGVSYATSREVVRAKRVPRRLRREVPRTRLPLRCGAYPTVYAGSPWPRPTKSISNHIQCALQHLGPPSGLEMSEIV